MKSLLIRLYHLTKVLIILVIISLLSGKVFAQTSESLPSSIVDYSKVRVSKEDFYKTWIFDFYLIVLKRNFDPGIKMKYEQNQYDYDEGVMFFMAPGQLLSIEGDENEILQKSGWMLLVHPDFLIGTPLLKTIKSYEFFKYSTHEALFLSEKEEQALNTVITSIEQEYQSVIDKHSQQIIVSQIDTLLAYSNRFYERQFITRKPMNHRILEKFEKIIDTAAKERLFTTNLSVSQIAYELGFDYPQSFSKLFKSKTK